jgi:hypothetical protein
LSSCGFCGFYSVYRELKWLVLITLPGRNDDGREMWAGIVQTWSLLPPSTR